MEVQQPNCRDDWVLKMRKSLCPEEMVNDDGTLNVDYFQPKSADDENLKWEKEDQRRLVIGIQKWGIGAWTDIKTEFLPIWDEVEIRMRSCVALGTQDLSAYEGWKGDIEALKAEKAKNVALAEKEGSLKFGVRLNKYGALVE